MVTAEPQPQVPAEGPSLAAPAPPSAVGDMMRERRKALRAVKANLDLKANDAAAKWSPNAALYKKRRALRHELAASGAAAAERTAEAGGEPGSGRKEKRKKFFSSLLDSPAAKPRTDSAASPAAAAAGAAAGQADESPQVRKRVHGVLQSPAEIRLSEAGKQARRQLTKLGKLTGFAEGADELVFTKRSQMFEPMEGAIFCSDLAPGLSEAAEGTAADEAESDEEQSVAAANVAAQFGQGLVAGAIAKAATEITML